MKFVIDSSVAICIYIDEPLSPAASKFMADGHDLFAPDSFHYEILGTLRKYERAGYATLIEDINRLLQLKINITPTAFLLRSAALISRTHDISPYDSLFLALSTQLNIPLITIDQRLVGATLGKPFDVRHVRDVA